MRPLAGRGRATDYQPEVGAVILKARGPICDKLFSTAIRVCPERRLLRDSNTSEIGSVTDRTSYYTAIPVISSLPDDVDALYLGLGGADAVNFLNQYQQAGGHAHLIGGSIMVDQTVLSSKGKAKDALIGTVAASGMADADPSPKWQAFVKAYQQAPKVGYFKNAFASPSLLAINYYNSAEAIFDALDLVKGDLSDGNKKFREALKNTVLDAPNGKFTLDENRQAIGPNFVTEVVQNEKGELVSKVVKVVPSVNQRLGFSKEVFDRIGLPGREVPECKKSYN